MESVHVDSEGLIECGRGPFTISLIVQSALYNSFTHINKKFLAFDSNLETVLFNLHNQIFCFEIAWNLRRHVEVCDRLNPFVWQSCLFSSFLLSRSSFLLWRRIRRGLRCNDNL